MSESTVRRRLFVHIGTHKTGTTSFQHWLREHEKELGQRFDLGVYQGAFPNNREVGLACARPERSLPTRGIDQWVDPEWRRHVATLVSAQLARDEDLVLSAEALSFLRHDDEIARFRDYLNDRETLIIVALRNPQDFLRSWAGHLTRGGYELSNDPTSFAYVEPDSWLADYDGLIRSWRKFFGESRVRIVNYDDSLDKFGSVIPALMNEVVGTEAALPEWRAVWKNMAVDFSSPEGRLGERLRRLTRHPITTAKRVLARKVNGRSR
jgi:hypothetical protein